MAIKESELAPARLPLDTRRVYALSKLDWIRQPCSTCAMKTHAHVSF
jgi:hypothetical protein